jgi:hypothetical protein
MSLVACGDDSPPDDPGSVAVVVAPTDLSLAQGGSGSATVTIARNGNFTGAVTLSQGGAPAGVGVTFSPATIAAGN